MRLTWILLPVIVLVLIASGALLTSHFTRAVQNPTLHIDMVPGDNTYSDPGGGGNNSMAVVFDPQTDFCLSTATANPAQHNHTAHIIVQNVEDLLGWQVRLDYTGDQFRPNTVLFDPFNDSNAGQNLSFVNLPLEAGAHRQLSVASDIPLSAPGPQTARFGAAAVGAPTFANAPDTPPKAIPDDNTYTALSGGVLASVTLQVLANQSGYLAIDMSATSPNGSGVSIFNGTTSQEMFLSETSLGGANHGEGVACQPPTATPAPTATPTVTPGPGGGSPTPGPGGGTRTPTRTPPRGPGASPTAALPPSRLPESLGSPGNGGPSDLAYVLLFTAAAVPVAGVTYGVIRLRRR